jgi:hypothetical protein
MQELSGLRGWVEILRGGAWVEKFGRLGGGVKELCGRRIRVLDFSDGLAGVQELWGGRVWVLVFP